MQFLTVMQQILVTLQKSTIATPAATDGKTRFWYTYRREAEEVDNEWVNRYNRSLDASVIFVSACL